MDTTLWLITNIPMENMTEIYTFSTSLLSFCWTSLTRSGWGCKKRMLNVGDVTVAIFIIYIQYILFFVTSVYHDPTQYREDHGK